MQLQVESIHDCHVIQYERKLLSLETHKRRRRHLTNRFAAGKRKSGWPKTATEVFRRNASVGICFFHCNNNKIDIFEAHMSILSNKLMMQLTFVFLFAVLRNTGKESKTSLTVSSSQEAEECAQEEREEVKEVLEPISNRVLEAELRKQMAASLECCHTEALSSSQAAVHNAGHKVSLLNILQQGWDLRSV